MKKTEQIPNAESDERIANILGDLKRVEAPENFEYAVRARIARGEPKESVGSFAILKVAIPAAALGLLAIFLYSAGYLSSDIGPNLVKDPTVRNAEQPNVAVTAEPNGAVPTEQPEQKFEIASHQSNSNVKSRVGTDQPSKVSNGGGSIDSAGNDVKVIRPPGFDPDQKRPGREQDLNTQRAIPVQNILQMVGIDAEFRGARCIANSVTDKSPAERAGVKSGDVIEAMNDIPITPSTAFKGGIVVESIRVNRAGRSIKLEKFN